MKIISLVSENIKRLRAVELRPEGKSLVIAGRNAQGKSSVLDSIVYALAGKSEVCERPIRDGESRAEITIDLDEFVVTRTFTAAGGGTLKVVPKGEKSGAASPQALLDKLIGTLTFDPLAFSRQKPQEQAAVLRSLVGLDFSDLDKQSAAAYAERLEVGRELDVLKGKTSAVQVNTALPEGAIGLAEIIQARTAAATINDKNTSQRKALSNLVAEGKIVEGKIRDISTRIEELQRQIFTLQKELDIQKDRHAFLSDEYLKTKSTVNELKDIDLSVFDKQLVEASDTNEAIRRNNELKVLIEQRNRKSARYAELSAALVEIDASRQRRLSETKFPLSGLSIASDGSVTFNSVPFAQISSAEQLKVSASIALALNPKLRVMLIRDGSLLDAESLEALKNLAANADAQLWIEKVGGIGTELPGVVIEDGAVNASTL